MQCFLVWIGRAVHSGTGWVGVGDCEWRSCASLTAAHGLWTQTHADVLMGTYSALFTFLTSCLLTQRPRTRNGAPARGDDLFSTWLKRLVYCPCKFQTNLQSNRSNDLCVTAEGKTLLSTVKHSCYSMRGGNAGCLREDMDINHPLLESLKMNVITNTEKVYYIAWIYRTNQNNGGASLVRLPVSGDTGVGKHIQHIHVHVLWPTLQAAQFASGHKWFKCTKSVTQHAWKAQ